MMRVKNHQMPPMILVDNALGISSEPGWKTKGESVESITRVKHVTSLAQEIACFFILYMNLIGVVVLVVFLVSFKPISIPRGENTAHIQMVGIQPK